MLLLVGAVMMMIQYAIQIPTFILLLKNRGAITLTTQIVTSLGSSFSGAFVLPIYSIALTLFYYDQRIRKEGYDVEWLMEQAGMRAGRCAGRSKATCSARFACAPGRAAGNRQFGAGDSGPAIAMPLAIREFQIRGRAAAVFALCLLAGAGPLRAAPIASNPQSPAEYRGHLKSLQAVVDDCRQHTDSAHCSADAVGPDDIVTAPGQKAPRHISYDWLRALLELAGNRTVGPGMLRLCCSQRRNAFSWKNRK